MSEPTEGLASSGPAQDAIPDPVDERAPFEPDGNVATIIFSRIADVQTRAALTMASRSWRDASRLLASLPKHNNGRLNLDGLSETQIDHLVDVTRPPVHAMGRVRLILRILLHADFVYP